MLFGILLTVQIIVCLVMGGLILIQRSEGGALGMGGGPSGFMSARGAGNLLTTLTGWLAFIFFANSIGLTIAGNMTQKVTSAVDAVDMSKIAAPTVPLTSGAATPAAATSSSAPSLSDLPLAGSLPVAPASQAPAAAPASHSPSTAPAPVLKMPAAASSSSLTQKQIDAAKANIFKAPASSSAAPSSTSSASK